MTTNRFISIEDTQKRIDAEAREGKCFYCHLDTSGSIGTLHLKNARGVVQHIHDECDKGLREELAFEAWQEAQLEERMYEPEHDQP